MTNMEVRRTANELRARAGVGGFSMSLDRADDAFTDVRILTEKLINLTGELIRGTLF